MSTFFTRVRMHSRRLSSIALAVLFFSSPQSNAASAGRKFSIRAGSSVRYFKYSDSFRPLDYNATSAHTELQLQYYLLPQRLEAQINADYMLATLKESQVVTAKILNINWRIGLYLSPAAKKFSFAFAPGWYLIYPKATGSSLGIGNGQGPQLYVDIGFRLKSGKRLRLQVGWQAMSNSWSDLSPSSGIYRSTFSIPISNSKKAFQIDLVLHGDYGKTSDTSASANWLSAGAGLQFGL